MQSAISVVKFERACHCRCEAVQLVLERGEKQTKDSIPAVLELCQADTVANVTEGASPFRSSSSSWLACKNKTILVDERRGSSGLG